MARSRRQPLDGIDNIVLAHGGHSSPEEGMCLLEAVSYIAGGVFGDHPKCVSPVLAAYGRVLNDRMDDESRQLLREFVPLLIGTASDGKDEVRLFVVADEAVRVHAARALEFRGFSQQAARLRDMPTIVDRASALLAHATALDAAGAAANAAYVGEATQAAAYAAGYTAEASVKAAAYAAKAAAAAAYAAEAATYAAEAATNAGGGRRAANDKWTSSLDTFRRLITSRPQGKGRPA